ncbi:MAG: polysaccharide biosynthesis tyrosine autokinase [Armatimonadetes bacterium]|nr:polysaccharide biosynthesis tyrosine autokinase [Armatimonadota bacterium]
METSQQHSTFQAQDYLQVIRKRKWFILVVAMTAMVIGGIYGVTYPKRYRATAWVVVYTQPETFFWGPGQQQSQQRSRQMSLDTQAALAESNKVAQMAAERLESRKAHQIIVSATEIADSITARAFHPDRIRIQAIHKSELHAVGFVNAAAKSFEELSIENRRAEDSAAVVFLEQQLVSTEGDLQKAVQYKQTKQKQWGIVTPDASQTAAGMLRTYESSSEEAQIELAATESRIVVLEQQLAGLHNSPISEQPVTNPYRTSLEAQLGTARMTLAQLQTRYTREHPAIQQAKLQIEELSKQIAEEPQFVRQKQVVAQTRIDGLSQQLETSRMQAASLRARISVLLSLITKTRSKTMSLTEKQNLLQQDQYEVGLHEQTYEALLQELRNRRLQKAATPGTADVLDRALRATPMEVNVFRSILFTGMLGLVAGIAFALLMEVLDTAIHTPDDIVQHTEVDFLGVIPLSETEKAGLLTVEAPRSPSAEAYRTLRSNINFATLDNPVRTFLVTSAGSGEGKSRVLANLGVVFAQAGQSVILVDSDLRRPNLHRLLDLDSTPGLTSVLMGEITVEDALQQTQIENLRVITSGPLPPNPTELLDSRRMDDFIAEVAGHANMILFDSPPSIMLADSIVLSAKLDTTILVAESGHVTRDAFNEIIRLINRARGDILGAVLNKMDVSRAGYHYYYYYYYYYDEQQRATEEPSDMDGGTDRVPILPRIQSSEPDEPDRPTEADTDQGNSVH